MPSENMGVSGIILAGGRSRRMGENKALLLIDGQRIIDRVAGVLCGIFQEVMIVGVGPESCPFSRLPCVPDIRPGCGSLGGIFTGLSASLFPRAFFVACDMPFLRVELIRYLISIDPEADVVIPGTEEGMQPLHAVYSRRCIPHIKELLDQQNYKIIDFFSKVRVRDVKENELRQHGWKSNTFFNINTKTDLALALEQVHREKAGE